MELVSPHPAAEKERLVVRFHARSGRKRTLRRNGQHERPLQVEWPFPSCYRSCLTVVGVDLTRRYNYLIVRVESLYIPADISTIRSPTLWFSVAVSVVIRVPTGSLTLITVPA